LTQDQVAALLKAGADANSACQYVGQTPLYMATRITLILPSFPLSFPFATPSAGALLPCLPRVGPGCTTLCHTRKTEFNNWWCHAGWRRAEAIRELLQHGADPQKADRFGKNAFDAVLAGGEDGSQQMHQLLQGL